MDVGKDKLFHVPYAKRNQVYQILRDCGVPVQIRPVLRHLVDNQLINVDSLHLGLMLEYLPDLQSLKTDILQKVKIACCGSSISFYRSNVLSNAVNTLEALDPHNFVKILHKIFEDEQIIHQQCAPPPGAGREAAKAHIINQVKDLSTIEQELCGATRDNFLLHNVIYCIDEIHNQTVAAYSRLNDEYLRKLKWGTTAKRLGTTIEETSQICTEIVNVLSRTHGIALEVIQKIENMNTIADTSLNLCLNELQRLASELFNSKWLMLQNMMVVNKHSPPVVKKETKTRTSVKFLAADKLMSETVPALEVEVLPLTETQALFLYNNSDPYNTALLLDSTKQKLRENVSRVQAEECTFTSFEILKMTRDKEYKSKSQKTDGGALEEKCCFLYRSVLQAHNCTFVFWCCSRPFVYVTHTCQEQKAWATMVWDKAFASEDRRPFDVPSTGPSDVLIEALNAFFKRETGTSWNFTRENKQYLKFKLKEKLSPSPHETIGEEDTMVDFHKFVHFRSDTYGNKPLSFWDWFYSIHEVTSKHLQKYWNEGYIVGFVPNPQRIQSSSELYQQDVGTAMIRFVDSIEGAISISYVTLDQSGNKLILSKEPVTADLLAVKGIAVRLTDIVDAEEAVRLYHYGVQNGDEARPILSEIEEVFGNDSRLEKEATNRQHQVMSPWYIRGG